MQSKNPCSPWLLACSAWMMCMLLVERTSANEHEVFVDSTTSPLEQHRSLWSVQITNAFDSARVVYELSEISIQAGNAQPTPVWLRLHRNDLYTRDAAGALYAGSNTIGPDSNLAAVASSRPFAVPLHGASVVFTRVLSAEACDVPDGPLSGASGTDDKPRRDDHRFLAGRGRIHDTSLFALQVVDAHNGVVLATIDSIGVLPNTERDYALRIGTAPDATRRTCSMPTSTHGRYVYLRVLPYRMGPTPYGMHVRRIPRMFGLSEQYTNTADAFDTEPSWLDVAYLRGRDSSSSSEFLCYAMREIAATGCTPWLPPGVHLYGHHQEVFLNMYRQQSATPAHCSSLRQMQRLWYESTVDGYTTLDSTAGNAAISTGVDVVISRNQATIRNRGVSQRNVRVHAVDMKGQQYDLATLTAIDSGAEASFTFANLQSGLYILHISSNGTILGVVPISITR